MTPEMERLGYKELDHCVYCKKPRASHVGPDYCVRYDAIVNCTTLTGTSFLASIQVP